MSFGSQDKNRITRSRYWLAMLINCVAVTVLLVGGIMALFDGSYVLGIGMMLAIVPVGIYFRVIMMRRCRDIGWPAYLPWALFGAGILGFFITAGSSFGGISNALDGGVGAGSALSGLSVIPSIVGLVDFGVMIALGCIAGTPTHDYSDVFGEDPGAFSGQPSGGFAGGSDGVSRRTAPAATAFASPSAETSSDDERGSWDSAIERALAKQKNADVSVADSSGGPAPAESPAMPQPVGFGRKGL